MTVKDILGMDFIYSETEITIQTWDSIEKKTKLLAKGTYLQDHVLRWVESDVEDFTWCDDNKVYINVK